MHQTKWSVHHLFPLSHNKQQPNLILFSHLIPIINFFNFLPESTITQRTLEDLLHTTSEKVDRPIQKSIKECALNCHWILHLQNKENSKCFHLVVTTTHLSGIFLVDVFLSSKKFVSDSKCSLSVWSHMFLNNLCHSYFGYGEGLREDSSKWWAKMAANPNIF